jgi:hypothetical protein
MTGPISTASGRCGRSQFSLQRALQHGQHAVGHVLLQAEHAQRRAALAGAVEGRGDDIADHLFGERGGIDDHGVLAAGLGDQRDRLSSGDRRSASWRWISRATSVEPVNITPRGLGAATRAAPIGRRRGPAAAHRRGTPASCRMRTASAAISGVSSAGLASTGLPATSAAATWPVKIASGKFHGLMQTTGPSGACAGPSVRAPARRSSAGSRSPRAPRRWRWAATCRLRARSARAGLGHAGLHDIGGASSRRRDRPGGRSPDGRGLAPPAQPRGSTGAGVASTTWPTVSR